MITPIRYNFMNKLRPGRELQRHAAIDSLLLNALVWVTVLASVKCDRRK